MYEQYINGRSRWHRFCVWHTQVMNMAYDFMQRWRPDFSEWPMISAACDVLIQLISIRSFKLQKFAQEPKRRTDGTFLSFDLPFFSFQVFISAVPFMWKWWCSQHKNKSILIDGGCSISMCSRLCGACMCRTRMLSFLLKCLYRSI